MASITMEAISTLVAQHRKALGKFSILETKFGLVRSTLGDHCQRLASLELALNDLGQRVIELVNLSSSLSENNSKLMSKVTDLEGGSR